MTTVGLPACRCTHPASDHKVGYAYGQIRHQQCKTARCKCHEYEPADDLVPTEPAAELEPKPATPTPVAPASILPPGTELVVAYPVLVCRDCGFAGAVPQRHIGCSVKAVRGYCLIVAEETTC